MTEEEAAEYEWEVVEPLNNDAAGHLHRAEARERLQRHDLRVHRHRRRHADRPALVRVPRRQHEQRRLGELRRPAWQREHVQPARRLHLRGLPALARPAHLRGPRGRRDRARRPVPADRGERRPDAGDLHVDDGRRHRAAWHRHRARARGRRPDRSRRHRVGVLRHSTTRRRPCSWSTSARSTATATSGLPGTPEWETCSTPSGAGGMLPGEHTFRVRGIDLAGNADPTPAMRTFTVVADADQQDHVRPRRARPGRPTSS